VTVHAAVLAAAALTPPPLLPAGEEFPASQGKQPVAAVAAATPARVSSNLPAGQA
jgi:hypothetical protein